MLRTAAKAAARPTTKVTPREAPPAPPKPAKGDKPEKKKELKKSSTLGSTDFAAHRHQLGDKAGHREGHHEGQTPTSKARRHKGSSSIKRGSNMTPTVQHDDVMEHSMMARMHAGHGGPGRASAESKSCVAPPPPCLHRGVATEHHRHHSRPAKPGAASMCGVWVYRVWAATLA